MTEVLLVFMIVLLLIGLYALTVRVEKLEDWRRYRQSRGDEDFEP